MKPNDLYSNQPKAFWAYVRSISEAVGYTARGQGQIKVPSVDDMADALQELGLNPLKVRDLPGRATPLGQLLLGYFEYRAGVLNDFVEPRLMDAARARVLFDKLRRERRYRWPIPMNKQKGKKKAPAYLTAMVNMIVERNCDGFECDFDPRRLTTVTVDGGPLRTLARRVDGAFPGVVNPVAIWEIKEYYYTTTFGSRVADGVYETLLDGMELQELHTSEGVHVLHYLMVDSHYTWWECGRSYLCRIVDMLHMGYVDEVLFGSEVIERLPDIVKQWPLLLRGPRAV